MVRWEDGPDTAHRTRSNRPTQGCDVRHPSTGMRCTADLPHVYHRFGIVYPSGVSGENVPPFGAVIGGAR